MSEIDSSLEDLEEEKKEAERNIDTINSVLVPYTISEDSMDEEEKMELSKQEEEEEVETVRSKSLTRVDMESSGPPPFV